MQISMDNPKYDIEVDLTEIDGNAFSIMGVVSAELKRAGASRDEITEYRKESMAGDYDHLLRTAMKWVRVN